MHVRFIRCGESLWNGWFWLDLNLDNTYAISGGATYHIFATGTGTINQAGAITVSVSGSPSFSAWYKSNGAVLYNIGAGVTFGSIVAGQKWQVGPAGYISTSGNTLPGPTAGSPAIGAAPTGATGWAS
jgi:hypothetical protein